jgi:glutamate racemase
LDKPIAVLDSGVGGLTVVREIMRQLPREEICYFGDTARCPYGSRPEHEVRQFSLQLVEYLLQFNPKVLVIACNTATASILEELNATLTIPVIGVIHPGVRAAIKATVSGRVGVIGTRNTVQSEQYEKALQEKETYTVVQEALHPLLDEQIDTLILGCTHYPLLAPVIQRVLGDEIQLISSADETAREVSTILFHKNLLSRTFGKPRHRFLTSGNEQVFRFIAEQWLKQPIVVEHVSQRALETDYQVISNWS